jgi:transcriptional regulator with XRE-family HTH domain
MLGDELRRARQQKEMTQEQLSFAAKVDRTYISELENNRKSPSIDVLLRLCKALGVRASNVIAKIESGPISRWQSKR